jgi:predicted RNA-binding Zn-ribbon protein involved in translation (DUF1610 family)
MSNNRKKINTLCLACRNNVDLGDRPIKGMMVICPKCGTELELIQVKPPLLDWPLVGIDETNEISDLDWEYYLK